MKWIEAWLMINALTVCVLGLAALEKDRRGENEMGKYAVWLIREVNRKRPDKPPVQVLYEGDDLDAAQSIALAATKNTNNRGLYVRFFDFHMFGGGMHDELIA